VLQRSPASIVAITISEYMYCIQAAVVRIPPLLA